MSKQMVLLQCGMCVSWVFPSCVNTVQSGEEKKKEKKGSDLSRAGCTAKKKKGGGGGSFPRGGKKNTHTCGSGSSSQPAEKWKLKREESR